MKYALTLLTALCCQGLIGPVLAVESTGIDKQAAAKIATQRFPGKVISVNPEKQEQTPIYRIKVLDEKGGMHTIIIHAHNGDVLSAH